MHAAPLYFGALFLMLSHLESSDDHQELFVQKSVETLRKIGPSILTLCSKKRRLYNRTDVWHATLLLFLTLLFTCLSAGPSAIRALLQLDQLVLDSLTEHIIAYMTIDISLFLDLDSGRAESPEWSNSAIKSAALSVLVKLVGVSDGGEAFTTRIGEILVPGGSVGLTGRQFAECFLDCAAKFTALKELQDFPEYEESVTLRQLQFIYQEFYKCSRLRPALGVFDRTFYNLQNNNQYESWAHARLNDTNPPT